MGAVELALFAGASFAAAFVAGLAGFAFGLVAMAIWLHLLTPTQTAILIMFYALIVQGYAVWKLRRALKPRRLLPFVIGGLAGIPLGVELLRVVPAVSMRVAIGVFMIIFSLYSLLKPALPPMKGERPMADGGIGVLSGIVGGATGLATILPTVWSTLRGWRKTSNAPSSSRWASPSSSPWLCGWRQRNDRRRDASPFPDRPARRADRNLGRPAALRPSRRGCFPADCAIVVAVFRHGPGGPDLPRTLIALPAR